MGTFGEIKEIPKKYRAHRDRFKRLFHRYEIDGPKNFGKSYRKNDEFRTEVSAIFWDIAKDEGGKLSLTTMGIIIGSALGGVGIAAMGSAIGLPLSAVLGVGGLLSGSKIDSWKLFRTNKNNSAKTSDGELPEE